MSRAPAVPADRSDLLAACDRAALLLLSGTTDEDERARTVRDVLAPFADDEREPDWVRQALSAALELLDAVTAGNDAPQGAFARVATLLDMIVRGEQAGAEAAPFALSATEVAELFPEFVAESLDHLEQVEQALLHIENGQHGSAAVDIAFRAFHTIKSTSAFLGFPAISELAHGTETMLCPARDDTRALRPGEIDAVLQAVDAMRELLARIGAAPAGVSTELTGTTGRPTSAQTSAQTSAPMPAPRSDDSTLRLRTDRVDQLIDLIGELVVAHSMVAQDALVQRFRHEPLAARVAHSSKIVRELQQLGMALRMVPLRALFHRLERLARDVARDAGKRIEFVVEGADAEVDRSMVDLLADPLIHMIRNAIDHGIEPPARRAAAGKPETGRIRLAACHVGGDVVVELSDDGRGLDADAIRARAVERGLLAADATPSASDCHSLIFAPGFSTATSVTGLSGRGVGMDVVRRNIEALGGRIEITTASATGTTFRLRVPLTLAVTDGMLVRSGAERYIVPTADIQTCFRPAAEQLTRLPGDGELVTRHDTTMPLVRLHERFGIPGAETDATSALVVVVREAGRPYGLLVDELLGQHQFVAKPVATGLPRTPGIAGTAILSDGCVGLLLDPATLLGAR